MNIKKYLQQLADKDAEKLITESDRLFYKQLAEQCKENEKQRKAEKLSKNDTGKS